MNFSYLYTARLILSPIGWQDIQPLIALKSDVPAFSHMLGGVRTLLQVQQELAEDIAYWGCHRIGMYSVWEKQGIAQGKFLGITGIHHRQDGRGYALRFALWQWAQGRGYAREAAYSVLSTAHERGHNRIIAVAKRENIASKRVLMGIGMVMESSFVRDNHEMIIYKSEVG